MKLKNNRMFAGCLCNMLAALLSVLVASVVIGQEMIMFNTSNVSPLMLALFLPALIEIAVYIRWFVEKRHGKKRDSDLLARSSLRSCLFSIVFSCAARIIYGSISELWEEGMVFLILAMVLSIAACLIQYTRFRPY